MEIREILVWLFAANCLVGLYFAYHAFRICLIEHRPVKNASLLRCLGYGWAAVLQISGSVVFGPLVVATLALAVWLEVKARVPAIGARIISYIFFFSPFVVWTYWFSTGVERIWVFLLWGTAICLWAMISAPLAFESRYRSYCSEP